MIETILNWPFLAIKKQSGFFRGLWSFIKENNNELLWFVPNGNILSINKKS